jgi:large subunit ribosomal protein L27
MGRDHTIYATESGYVKYYKDPERHPKRQYIGVVFERDQVLPLPRNAQRRRRLNMVAVKMEAAHPSLPGAEGAEPVVTDLVLENGVVERERKREVVKLLKKKGDRKGEEGRNLQLRPGYMYREGNWEIGRAAERAGVRVKAFKPRDRWTAWKKREVRFAKNAEKRSLGRKIGGK